MNEARYIEAVGRRKNARARVRMTPTSRTTVEINGKSLDSYFPTEELRLTARAPLEGNAVKLKISVKVNGGGLSSQAQAMSLGLARALSDADASIKPILKKAGFLSRDSRIKERRKFGLKKARKAPQWSKR